MNNRTWVFQLDTQDTTALITLLEMETLTQRNPSRWSRVLRTLKGQFCAQLNGEFYQCAACFEEVNHHATSDPLPQD